MTTKKKNLKALVRFVAAPGSGIKDDEADAIGRRFQRIAGEDGLAPKAVVEDARNPRSPLHKYFDWNDETAAHAYRLAQARKLIGSIQIERTDGARPRAFHSVVIERMTEDEARKERRYIETETILSEDKLCSQTSLELYSTIRAAVEEADNLGLCEKDPKWRRIRDAVTRNEPIGSALARTA